MRKDEKDRKRKSMKRKAQCEEKGKLGMSEIGKKRVCA